MVNPVAPELKTISLTVVFADTEISVVLETPNVAISVGPSGTVRGIQLAAVSQSLLIELSRQVALSAKEALSATSESIKAMPQDKMGHFIAAIVSSRPPKGKRILATARP